MALTVLVTGANRGLGLEFARQYAARGDRVVAGVRNPGAAGAVPEIATVVELDTASQASIERLAAELAGESIDVLINNAGVMGEDKPLASVNFDEFARVMATNTFGPAVLTRAMLPHLKRGGKKTVANISSELGSSAQNWPGFSYAYCASKAALNRITAQMGKDLRRDGVIVTALCPGWNKTDMGGKGATLDPAESVAKLIGIIDGLTPSESGKFIRHDGGVIPY